MAHSWSPVIHGMFAAATAQHLVYEKFDVAPERFRDDVLRLFEAGVRGLNITVPHKQAAAALVHELTPRAARARAVNTIAVRDDTTLLGDNTDGAGLTADLESNLRLDLADKRVLIVGAGGAVRGVLAPLLGREPRLLTIANRTAHKAQALATEFSDLGTITGCGFGDLGSPAYDLIVNATSAGLQGEQPVLPDAVVGASTLCYDMSYGRSDTPFIRWARAHHAATAAQGWGMLVEQAAESFLLWRGVRPATRPVLAALAKEP